MVSERVNIDHFQDYSLFHSYHICSKNSTSSSKYLKVHSRNQRFCKSKDGYVNSFFLHTTGPWNSLLIECFPLNYDLNGFKSRINRHLQVLSKEISCMHYSFCTSFFFGTPCLVVDVQPYTEWIPIEEKARSRRGCFKQALAWRMGNSPCPHCHMCKSRKRRLGWAMKSPPKGKAAWADIAHTKF